MLIAIAYYTLLERKLIAAIQSRKGPSVVGIFGLLQPLADGLKLFFKEYIVIKGGPALLFIIAPFYVLLISFAY